MKKTPLLNTKLVQHMDVPMIPNVLMLDAGENLDDKLFVRGDLLDALSVDIYFKDVKSKLLTVFDVVTTKLRNHISDTYCHTNPAEKRYWNNKLDKATFDEAFSVLKARLDGWEGRLEDIERTIGNLPDFDTFALKTDIEGVYVSYDDLEDALDALNIPTQEDLEDFVKQSDLEGYLKEGDILGTINGQVFHQGDNITVEGGGGGLSTPYKITEVSVNNSTLTLKQENNPSSPFNVTLPSGGGGSSYVLPPATSTTLGGIKVGFGENNKNYAVRLDGNSNAYVTVPWHASEGGEGGEDGGYWEIIFTSTLTENEPSLPAYSDGLPAGWSHSAENSDGTKIIWMANRWVAGDGTKSNWNGPWRISGPNGVNGVDGNEYEYIYTRTNSDDSTTVPTITNTPSSSSTGRTPQEDDFVPVNWTDNPQGVDETIRYEWVAIRKKVYDHSNPDGIWGAFSAPVIWSSYGRNGTDGDGIEYIFYLDTSGTNPPQSSSSLNWPPSWENDSKLEYGIDYQDPEYIRPGSSWTDNPQAMTVQGCKQWVSIRKQQNGIWQAYSIPTLWSYYAKDGESGTVQYLEYPVLRYMGIWDANALVKTGTDSDGNTVQFVYNDGTINEGGMYYQDIVEYDGSQIQTAHFYKCKQHHGVAHSPVDTNFWVPFIANGDAAFDAIIANSAYIQSLSVELLVVFDNDNNVCAGMSGNSATVGQSDIRIWAGAPASGSVPGNLAAAPFTVDQFGKLRATDAILSGQLTVGNLANEHVFIGSEPGQSGQQNIIAIRDGQSVITLLGGDYEVDQSVINFIANDGSGKVAGGNLNWDEYGNITLGGDWWSEDGFTHSTYLAGVLHIHVDDLNVNSSGSMTTGLQFDMQGSGGRSLRVYIKSDGTLSTNP